MRSLARLPLFLLPVMIAGTAAGARAQETPAALTITVVDGTTRAPLAGAMVSVGGRMRGTSDAQGVVRVATLEKGRHVVQVARIGYATTTADVTVGDEPVAQTVALGTRPGALAPVEAQARRTARQQAVADFYERKERGHTGYFVTREDNVRRTPRRVSDLFRSLPNLRVAESEGNARLESRRAMPGTVANCSLLYYVDGVLSHLLSDGSFESLMESVNAEFKPEEIEGIEVYLGGNAPPRYQGSNGRCGVVLVWTVVGGN